MEIVQDNVVRKATEESDGLKIAATFLAADERQKTMVNKIAMMMCQEKFNYNQMMQILELCCYTIRSTAEISSEKLSAYKSLNGSRE